MSEPGPESGSTRLVVSEPSAGVLQLRALACRARRNAVGIPLLSDLRPALARARADDSVRAVVVTGAGGMFSAGGDLKDADYGGYLATARARRLVLMHQQLEVLHRLPKPTIAAVEGGAVGIGWSLTLACDLTVAASNADFLAPFVSRGLIPDGGCAWFLSRAIGTRRTAELLMLADRLPAADAASLGLVNRLTEPGGALPAALELAGRLASGAPDALSLTKRLLAATEHVADYGGFLEQEWATAALCMSGPGPEEGRAAFLEARREPDFRGSPRPEAADQTD